MSDESADIAHAAWELGFQAGKATEKKQILAMMLRMHGVLRENERMSAFSLGVLLDALRSIRMRIEQDDHWAPLPSQTSS